MAIYLDCNATTQLEPSVLETVTKFMAEEFGNSGSRTHEYGLRAKKAVEMARADVAEVVKADKDEVIFTSGATESNNLALLGLEAYGTQTVKRHIISTAIEHKAVLEPLEVLSRKGFEVTLVQPDESGRVSHEAVLENVRDDTLLVSVMQVNNETGVSQPIVEIADCLGGHPAFFHVDAAQGFGKDIAPLRHPRVDLISISGHKIYAPKGVGVLIARRRGFRKVPLQPLMFGGGQEKGLRPGTLPVPLIAGLGRASKLAVRDHEKRAAACRAYKREILKAMEPLGAVVNGSPEYTLPHVLSLSFPGIDSEALMVSLKETIAISNGSACTSSSYKPSHVLEAMGLPGHRIQGAVRLSWSHMTSPLDWSEVAEAIRRLM